MFQKRDLTCKRSRCLHVLEEERLFGSSRAERDFWAHLGVEGGEPVSVAPAGPPGEDEEYEQEVNEMNMVWEVRAGGFLLLCRNCRNFRKLFRPHEKKIILASHGFIYDNVFVDHAMMFICDGGKVLIFISFLPRQSQHIFQSLNLQTFSCTVLGENRGRQGGAGAPGVGLGRPPALLPAGPGQGPGVRLRLGGLRLVRQERLLRHQGRRLQARQAGEGCCYVSPSFPCFPSCFQCAKFAIEKKKKTK